jgi:hypothetical protein
MFFVSVVAVPHYSLRFLTWSPRTADVCLREQVHQNNNWQEAKKKNVVNKRKGERTWKIKRYRKEKEYGV